MILWNKYVCFRYWVGLVWLGKNTLILGMKAEMAIYQADQGCCGDHMFFKGIEIPIYQAGKRFCEEHMFLGIKRPIYLGNLGYC